tara:strand:+ start:892 stop:1218 length:327 start_codon:yes stop_codon:yes gene_type:complete
MIISKMKKDRFDLEEAITNMYNVCDDIDVLLDVWDSGPLDEDTIMNMLIGIKALHKGRFEKMWAIFEELIVNKTINDPDDRNPFLDSCAKDATEAPTNECNNEDLYYK